VALLVLAAPTSAGADDVKLITGPTPFPHSCSVPGTPTLNSAGEPTMAVNPRSPANVIVSWQQDRFNADGGDLSNLVGVSTDSGRHFHTVRVPGISRCTGGADERASDPWLSIGPDGTAYLASLSFSEMPQNTAVAGPTKLVVSRSRDGGETWSAPVDVAPFDQTYNDREAVTADPRRPGTAYFAFVKRYGAEGESGLEFFSRTTDGGSTWSSPAPIYTPPPGMLTDPTLIEVLPDGTLVNFLIVANLSPFLPSPSPRINWTVVAQRSTDGGTSWSGATNIASIDPFPAVDPDTGRVVRAYPVISTAVAGDGSAYVAWNDIPSPTSGSKVMFARSTDSGRSWSTPGVVSRSPGQAFLPSIAVARDGTLGVTYDDTRNTLPGSGKLSTDVWFVRSRDHGASWRESHVSGPFDTLTAPQSDSAGVQGFFLGDYQALAALPTGGFGAVFAQSRPLSTHGPSDMFFARLGVGGPALASSAQPREGLALSIRPGRVRPGVRRRFRIRVTTVRGHRRLGVPGAVVDFGGRKLRTGRRGGVRVVLVLPRRGRVPVRVRARGLGTRVEYVQVGTPRRRGRLRLQTR